MNEETKANLEWAKNVTLAIVLFVISIATCFGAWQYSPVVGIKICAVLQFALDGYLFYKLWKKIMNQNKK